MYHIHHDRRSEHSAEAIYQALSAVMQEKSFDKITISDLTRKCSFSRATFYRSFDEVDDVLAWKCNARYQEMNDAFEAETGHAEDGYAYLRHFFNYWMKDENSLVLEQLISIGHYDVIYQIHTDNSMLVRQAIHEQVPQADAYYDYYMAAVIGAFIGFLITWIKHGRKLSADQLINMVQSVLDPDFHQV